MNSFFEFTGFKSNELFNFNVKRLAFNYQDTLSFTIVAEDGQMNKDFATSLDNIEIWWKYPLSFVHQNGQILGKNL